MTEQANLIRVITCTELAWLAFHFNRQYYPFQQNPTSGSHGLVRSYTTLLSSKCNIYCIITIKKYLNKKINIVTLC